MPQFCKKVATFIVEASSLRKIDDAWVDGNGVFPKAVEIKWKVIEIKEALMNRSAKFLVTIQSVGKQNLEGKSAMRVHRTKHPSGLVRNVVYFVDSAGAVINNRLVLQYYIDQKIAGK